MVNFLIEDKTLNFLRINFLEVYLTEVKEFSH